MFTSELVCLLAGLCKNYSSDLNKNKIRGARYYAALGLYVVAGSGSESV